MNFAVLFVEIVNTSTGWSPHFIQINNFCVHNERGSIHVIDLYFEFRIQHLIYIHSIKLIHFFNTYTLYLVSPRERLQHQQTYQKLKVKRLLLGIHDDATVVLFMRHSVINYQGSVCNNSALRLRVGTLVQHAMFTFYKPNVMQRQLTPMHVIME